MVLLVVWVLTLGSFGYALLDQGVTLTYQGDEFQRTRQDLETVQRLLPAIQGRDRRAALLDLLRAQNPTAFIVATDSTVGIGGLTFRFGPSGRLRAVGRE